MTSRREALKILAATAAAPALAAVVPTEGSAQTPAPPASALVSGHAGPRGTPSDPDLIRPMVTWKKLLTAPELHTVAALCDIIIPADAHSPGASTLGVPDYINEYVSAPIEGQQSALVMLRGGLGWLNTESTKRYGKAFGFLSHAQKTAICDDICYAPKAKPEFAQAAAFFAFFRNLTATGFYTTPEGMKDLRYVGNMAQPKWDGPPPEVLRHIGM